MGILKDAIARWIRAEALFRFGPRQYETTVQDWYVQAEDDLREALTGERDLVKAAQALGLDVLSDPTPPSKPAPKPKPAPAPTPAPAKRKRLSLWD